MSIVATAPEAIKADPTGPSTRPDPTDEDREFWARLSDELEAQRRADEEADRSEHLMALEDARRAAELLDGDDLVDVHPIEAERVLGHAMALPVALD